MRDGQVRASAADLPKLHALLDRDPEDYDLIAQVPQDGAFEEWHRQALAAHVEYRRRVRG